MPRLMCERDRERDRKWGKVGREENVNKLVIV